MPNALKNYINFSKGINTEASVINFPDGYSQDEENYTLLIDGSRRRRLGLGLEQDGSAYTLPYTYTPSNAVRSFDWENVSGNPLLNFLVIQIGFYLHIYRDVDVLSTNKSANIIDLRLYRIAGATDQLVANSPVDCAYGRGHLFVCHRYLSPFWVKYTSATDTFTISVTTIQERDFEGVDDGYSNSAQPSTAVDSHTYNLQNRGWTAAQITAFATSQSRQPSKSMIPWLGLQRTTTAGIYDAEGVRQFSPAKLVQELFQDASAPQGHFIRNPFDTTATPISGPTTDYAISTWTISGTSGGTQTITVTTSGNHGRANGETVSIQGTSAYYISTFGSGSFPDFYVPYYSFDGNYVVSAVTATTFQIQVEFISDFNSWLSQYASLGTVITSSADNPGGTVSGSRFKTVAFFAGRVWYAGAESEKLSTKIYFSQVIEADAQYGKCYQVADPTDERISDLVPSDGGVITIPEAANVLRILPYESSLLVFASNGVWRVGPGESGYFTATSYSIRKITDSGAVGPGSVIVADNVPMYWSLTDIYAIVQDSNSGFLVAQNMSEQTINTLFNNIPQEDKIVAQAVFDDLNKKVYWLYNTSSSLLYNYNKALIFDTRQGAFTKYGFGNDSGTGYVASIFITKQGLGTRKVKYIGLTSSSTIVQVLEANNYTDYKDFGITEPECFILTGHDTVGDPGSKKYSPYVYVFSKKTEQGFSVVGDDYTPIRESSTKMQARWDWADNSVAGKWGQLQEVYRHQRLYTPSSPGTDTFNDGVPLVVTKNSIRGTGRSVHLKFTAGVGKDSWLAGWQMEFDRIRN